MQFRDENDEPPGSKSVHIKSSSSKYCGLSRRAVTAVLQSGQTAEEVEVVGVALMLDVSTFRMYSPYAR